MKKLKIKHELFQLKFVEAHVKPMDSHKLAKLPLTAMHEQIRKQEKQFRDQGIISARANDLLTYLRSGGVINYFRDGRGTNYRKGTGERIHPDVIRQLSSRGFLKI